MKTIASLAKFLLERNKEIAKMHHLQTQEIVKNIYVIKTKDANFYIIKNDEEYIAIDAGGGGENIAKAQLEKLNIEPEKITAVFLTHTDFDHISALGLFKNATIYVSKQEEQILDGTVPRMFGMKNRLKHAYNTIDSDEEIFFGAMKIKPILTPGHTTGSMSYLLNNKYLFVGDALRLKDGQVSLFNSLFNMDDEIHKQSLKQLAKIQHAEYIFTAHYGFSNNYEAAFENFRAPAGGNL